MIKFNESNCKLVNLRLFPKCYIYFLVNDKEVVYVGQTIKGLNRLAAHLDDKEKEFDKIYILPCEPNELDQLEDKFIRKYCPRYNKKMNVAMNYSVHVAAKLLLDTWQDGFECPCKCTDSKFKKMLKALDITPFKFNNHLYISKEEYKIVDREFERWLMREIEDEVFNIRV